MRMRIDDARDDVKPVRIELAGPRVVDPPDCDDPAADHTDIGSTSRQTGPIDHDSVPDDEIKGLARGPSGHQVYFVRL